MKKCIKIQKNLKYPEQNCVAIRETVLIIKPRPFTVCPFIEKNIDNAWCKFMSIKNTLNRGKKKNRMVSAIKQRKKKMEKILQFMREKQLALRNNKK